MIHLARKLRGIAHVFIQSSLETNDRLRAATGGRNEYWGAVGIYFPTPLAGRDGHRRYLCQTALGEFDDKTVNQIIHTVIRYASSQRVPPLATWSGVLNALLSDRLDSQRKKREAAEMERKAIQERITEIQNSMDETQQQMRHEALEAARYETDKLLATFEDDFSTLERQVEEQAAELEKIRYENEKLHEKLGAVIQLPVIFFNDEVEIYEGEIKELILDALAKAVEQVPPQSRRQHVYQDIIAGNNYQKLSQQRKATIKNNLQNYKEMTPGLRRSLEKLGFTISEGGKHYIITYGNDPRYKTTFGKTPSDHRAGKNNAAEIAKNFF